jgi:hypothetical protein
MKEGAGLNFMVGAAVLLPASALGTCGMVVKGYLTNPSDGAYPFLVPVSLDWAFLICAAAGALLGFAAVAKILLRRAEKPSYFSSPDDTG